MFMADWRQEIDEIFKGQGFEKKIPELNAEEQLLIQEFLDNIGKPAFENFCDQLNSFNHVRAEVVTSKKTADSPMEQVELNVFKVNQPRLTYRLRFSKKDKHVQLEGEYSTPNIYGENTRFHKTSLDRIMNGTSEEDIAQDFSYILRTKF
jgi:hypothetical protein